MRRLLVVLLLAMPSVLWGQSQYLTRDEYVAWLMDTAQEGTEIMTTCGTIAQLASSDPDGIRLLQAEYSAVAWSNYLRAMGRLEQWRKIRHPAPFHETDRLMGRVLETMTNAMRDTYMIFRKQDVSYAASAQRSTIECVLLLQQAAEAVERESKLPSP